MHDEHRLKDRIDLSLDNRQIFLLFVASAVVVTLVFALGVVVGKRMAPAVAAKAPTDPLALLDQLGKQAQDDDLTFPSKLTAPKTPKANGAAASADAGAAGTAAGTASTGPAVKPVLVKGSKAQAAAGAEQTKRKGTVEAKAKGKSKAKATAKGKSKSKARAAKKAKRARGIASKQKTKGQKKAAAVGGYTLQLSSFQDKTEAEQYMAKLRVQGLSPHMIPARIPGRGVWYRVRLGTYASWDEAVEAKKKVEQQQQLIAYVARN